MKKVIVILGILFFHSYICVAQTNDSQNKSKVEEVKIAFFTHQLNLTKKESAKFWPVYNGYFLQLKKTWYKYRKNRPVFDEKAAALKDKYRNAFVQILNSHERAGSVFKAEKAYRAMLRQELKNRQRHHPAGRAHH